MNHIFILKKRGKKIFPKINVVPGKNKIRGRITVMSHYHHFMGPNMVAGKF